MVDVGGVRRVGFFAEALGLAALAVTVTAALGISAGSGETGGEGPHAATRPDIPTPARVPIAPARPATTCRKRPFMSIPKR